MKIAFILEYFPRLSETFILNQITGLLDLGHEIDIYARHNPNENVIHKDIKRYNLMEKTLYFAEPNNIFSRILKAVYLLFKNFRNDPIKIMRSLNFFHYEKDIPLKMRLLLPLEYLYLTIFFLKKNYDIIHCHFGRIGKYGVFLKRMGITAKLITTFYGTDLTHMIKKYGRNYYKALLIHGDLFLPICNYFKRILINLECKKKIRVHPLGIDTDKFRNTAQIEFFNPNRINIFSVGRFIEKKGFEYSIKALSKINLAEYNIQYLIVGDGPLKSKLEKLTRELKIEKYVKFLGSLKQEDVIKIFKKSHIFILSSVTAKDGDKEGTPTVLLEAQSMSIPVISTYHSGIPEIVIDQKSGLLVPERDSIAIKEKLLFLLNNPEKCKEMSSFAREFARKHFDIKNLNKRLISLYQTIK